MFMAHGLAVATLTTAGASTPTSELANVKVFVYSLPAWLCAKAPRALCGTGRERSVTSAFGGPFAGSLHAVARATDQYAFTLAFVYRLLASPHYRTSNASNADLFFVPVFPELPRPAGASLRHACEHFSAADLAIALPHLNEHTAHKHILPLAHEHHNGHACRGWFADPTGPFTRAIRLAYSEVQPELPELRADVAYRKLVAGDWRSSFAEATAYPNLVSVPFVSMVHSTDHRTPWAWARTAPHLLMLFLGSDAHGDVEVRQRVLRDCRRYARVDAGACHSEEFSTDKLPLKLRATFCLEPAGAPVHTRTHVWSSASARWHRPLRATAATLPHLMRCRAPHSRGLSCLLQVTLRGVAP